MELGIQRDDLRMSAGIGQCESRMLELRIRWKRIDLAMQRWEDSTDGVLHGGTWRIAMERSIRWHDSGDEDVNEMMDVIMNW